MFGFSQTDFLIGFDTEGGLFGYNYFDDSKFIAGQPPTDYTPKAYCEYPSLILILFFPSNSFWLARYGL